MKSSLRQRLHVFPEIVKIQPFSLADGNIPRKILAASPVLKSNSENANLSVVPKQNYRRHYVKNQ